MGFYLCSFPPFVSHFLLLFQAYTHTSRLLDSDYICWNYSYPSDIRNLRSMYFMVARMCLLLMFLVVSMVILQIRTKSVSLPTSIHACLLPCLFALHINLSHSHFVSPFNLSINTNLCRVFIHSCSWWKSWKRGTHISTRSLRQTNGVKPLELTN